MKARGTALVTCSLLILVALGLGFGPAAQASCAGPTVEVAPTQAPKGSPITITGAYYWDRCNDTITCYMSTPSPSPGSPSPTPTQSCYGGEPEQPLQNIRLEFVQGGRVWKLGTVDADSMGRIKLEALVPSDADFGSAKIHACPYAAGCAYPVAEFRVVGVLASTGSNVPWMITPGALALAAGLGLAALRRSGRAPH